MTTVMLVTTAPGVLTRLQVPHTNILLLFVHFILLPSSVEFLGCVTHAENLFSPCNLLVQQQVVPIDQVIS